MAKHLSIEDYAKVPVINLRLENLASAPSPAPGDVGYVYFDSTLGYIRAWTGSAWVNSNNLPGSSTVTSAMIVDGTIVDADINSAAGIQLSKLATDPLARANHTGTQLASTISNFDTQVRTSRLDQMAAPTANISLNNQRFTSSLDPASPQDLATKAYVDAARTGLNVKNSARAASTANVTVTYNATGGTSGRGQITGAPNTLDGVSLVQGDSVLLKDQTTGAQNGIWTVSGLGSGSNGIWDRRTDFDSDAEVTSGAFTFVSEGTANADQGFVLTTNDPIVIGGASGTSLVFTQFSGAGQITAGAGLTKTANTLDVIGTLNRVLVNADSVDISPNYMGQTSITTLGTITAGTWTGTTIAVANGGTGGTTPAGARTGIGAAGKYAVTLSTSSTTYTVNHALGSSDVVVAIVEVATSAVVTADVILTDANNVTVNFAAAPAANAYRVIVVG